MAHQELNHFGGRWIIDSKRSESMDNHYIAMDINFVVRQLIKAAFTKVIIEIDGIQWTENSGAVKTIMAFDGKEVEVTSQNKKVKSVHNIIDKVSVESNTIFENGIVQHIKRTLEEEGNVLHVSNKLTTADGTVHNAEVYFNKEK